MRPEPYMSEPHLNYDSENHLVNGVSWYEAMEFCSRLSAHTGRRYRLPTEAEWEYARKAGTTTLFSFGESVLLQRSQLPDEFIPLLTSPSAEVNNQMYLLNFDGLMKGTTPLGSYPANSQGLYDMHGNVWEWCFDGWHQDYSTKPETVKHDGHQPWQDAYSRARKELRPVQGEAGGPLPMNAYRCLDGRDAWSNRPTATLMDYE